MSIRMILASQIGALTPVSEVEIGFEISEERYKYIKTEIDTEDFPSENTTTLDINYTQPEGTYRVTLTNKTEINEVVKQYERSNANIVFAEILKRPSSKFIIKQRKKEIPIEKVGRKIRISEENKPEVDTLSKVQSKFIKFRLKERFSQIVYNHNDYLIKIELTKVSSGNKLSDISDNISHEIEIELTTKKKVKTLPKTILSVFEKIILEIYDLTQVEMPKRLIIRSPHIKHEGIEVNEWVTPNKVGFLSWIYDTFKTDIPDVESKGCNAKKEEDKPMALFPHQKFVKDYLQYESPFRGLLLYHGLGSGKTCSSIAAAEGFISHSKKVIILSPASLHNNYRQEILKCASIGNPTSKLWTLIDAKNNKESLEDYFVSRAFARKHKYKVWIPSITGNDDLIVRRDVSWDELTNEEKELAKETLNDIIDNKYYFIAYNGITSKALGELGEDFFNNSFVVIDEVHNFSSRVVNGVKISRKIYEMLMAASGMKIVVLSGTPIINHPFELAITLNLVKGTNYTYVTDFTKTDKFSYDDIKNGLIDSDLYKYINGLDIDVVDKRLSYVLYPENFVATNNSEIKFEHWERNYDGIAETIHEYLRKNFGIGKSIHKHLVLSYPNNKKDFETDYLDLTDIDNPRIKNIDQFTRRAIGAVSYLKNVGEEYFPRVTSRSVVRVNMSDYQFSQYVKKRDEERKMESTQRRSAGGVLGNKNTVYRAFSRMSCNFVFPEHLKRTFPKDLRKAAQREIDASELDSELEETETKMYEVKKPNKADIDAEYYKKLDELMKQLVKESKTILTPEALNGLYSPKMQKVFEAIDSNEGKALLYSQFKMIEGLGILKAILDFHGYKEVRVTHTSGFWNIVGAAEVLKPKYNGKRYITFDTSERDKSKLLLQLFNDDKEMPEEMKGDLTNLNGEFIKLIMITQSGAEGISLTNTRNVFILEPFWNMVRMEQVIGRAVRVCSHKDLPEDKQTVNIIIFCSVLTPEQLKSNFTLRRLDKGLSSDLHILQIAEKKDELIQTFLNYLKMASVDCRINASANKLTNQGLQCYSFPINIDSDYDILKKHQGVERRRKIKGHAIMYKNKKYVIVDDFPDKYYDYTLYNDAGVLQEVIPN